MNANFSAFKSFVLKEFLHIFRDIRTMLIVFFMPIVQILLFGFVLSAEVNHINFAVFNPNSDLFTQKILTHFSQTKYFEFKKELHSKEEIANIFKTNAIDLVLVFENNFSENLQRGTKIQILLDASEPNYASISNLYAINTLNQAILNELKLSPNHTITTLTTMLFNPSLKSVYNFVPGLLALILMLICALMTSISIVREKEQGSMEVLLVSHFKPSLMIFAKILPYFVISCVSLGAVLCVSVFILELKITGNLFFVLLFCMLYLALALSVGILVSTLAKTQVTAMLVCIFSLLLPVVMLSGMIFPIESMPKILQVISAILPPRWFISGLKKIMIEGVSLEFVTQEIAILLFMTLIVNCISLKKFNLRLG